MSPRASSLLFNFHVVKQDGEVHTMSDLMLIAVLDVNSLTIELFCFGSCILNLPLFQQRFEKCIPSALFKARVILSRPF
jgi:hypothetical protein